MNEEQSIEEDYKVVYLSTCMPGTYICMYVFSFIRIFLWLLISTDLQQNICLLREDEWRYFSQQWNGWNGYFIAANHR